MNTFWNRAPYLNDEARRNAKPLRDNNTIDGRNVALPLYMSGGMLFYRADLLKKYGYCRSSEYVETSRLTWRCTYQNANGARENDRFGDTFGRAASMKADLQCAGMAGLVRRRPHCGKRWSDLGRQRMQRKP